LILQRYLLKEVSKTFFIVFLIIFSILLSTQLLRILSSVTDGKIPIDFLFLLLGLRNIESMTLVLPLALFLGIILSLSRLYKDNEVVAMFSSGIGPSLFIKSFAPAIFLLFCIESLLVLYISPWSNVYVERITQVAAAKADVNLLESGRFTILSNANTVIYVESIDKEKNIANVFIRIREGTNSRIIFSEQAKVQTDTKSGMNYFILKNGSRYEGIPGGNNYQLMSFEEYGMLLKANELPQRKQRVYSMSVEQLWQNKEQALIQAEIQWRISMVLSVVILSLLAIPLGKTSPRKGRFAMAFPALVVYFFYYTFLKASQNWIKVNDFPYWLGMWWVHLLFLAFFIFLYGLQLGWFQTLRTKKV